MKRENKQMIFIYLLVFIIIVLLIFLTKIILDANKKEELKPKQNESNVTHDINSECTFNVTFDEYNRLTSVGCSGKHNIYDINDINLDGMRLKVSINHADIQDENTGLYINDKKITNSTGIGKIKFGIFSNMLFVFDTSKNNVLVFNKMGENVYNLNDILNKNQIKENSLENETLKISSLDPASFIFAEGAFEFNSSTNSCQNGEIAKGSHYKVTYNGETFNLPEFMNLINCQ